MKITIIDNLTSSLGVKLKKIIEIRIEKAHIAILAIFALFLIASLALTGRYVRVSKEIDNLFTKNLGASSIGYKKDLENEIIKVSDIEKQARSAQDLSICEDLESEDEIKQCKINTVTGEAVVKLDVDICDKLLGEEEKSACRDNVLIVRAKTMKDAGICDLLGDETRIKECRQSAVLP